MTVKCLRTTVFIVTFMYVTKHVRGEKEFVYIYRYWDTHGKCRIVEIR